jgi:4-amino-4-deoxy-L-arabinose transferase-like glycosyltransferase
MGEGKLHSRTIDIVSLAVILVVGIFLRLPADLFRPAAALHALGAVHPAPAFDQVGFDEGLYREYVKALSNGGLTSYPDVVQGYIEVQEKLTGSILPPLRFLYIFAGYLWHSIFGSEPLTALRDVASSFSILTLALATFFVWRIRGPIWAIAIAALLTVAPTQLHMSQHALVDGFFTFWTLLALWLLWENLQAPSNWRWLAAYVVALALLVLTKENSFFVWVALLALLVANRWLQFGTVSREIVVATFLGPILGLAALFFLAGGVDVFVRSYQLSVGKNFQLNYAIMTGDGPWYRYLVDLFLVSPIVLLLAIGTVGRLTRTMKPELFMSVFIAASYLVMCNVKYGMNLRYANMWDMPLRFLAFSEIVWLTSFAKKVQSLIIAAAVLLLAIIEFHQYIVLAVRYPLYELVPFDLLRALHILKFSSELQP